MAWDTEEAVDFYAGGEPDDDLEEDMGELDRGDLLEGEELEEEETPEEEPEEEETPEEAPTEEQPEEEEPEEEETPEEVPEEEVKRAQRESQRIPKQRFDEVNLRRQAAEAKAKQLEEELKRLQGSSEGVEEFDFDAKEEEYMSAVVDGEFAKAKAVRAEIRRAEQTAYQQQMVQTRSEAVTQTQAELDYRSTVRELEAAYPVLDYRNQESYDQLATQEALELHAAYMQMGKYQSPSDSLRAAVNLIAVKYNLDAPGAEEVEPEVEAPAPRPRAATAKRKKAAAAASQPKIPSNGSVGTPASVDFASMSDDEFDALPETKKAELRGDLM